ncbi:hypothetical protein [Hymenobacter cheonanensis]|uniref:hypothetical protein n=1 Tax=Hymenobacter sp. CA2-7 TaxID=3063993 RepID=UPI00272AD68E|nr:hypothetical protein [Hymenobacter sp. CA2-7]
MPQQNADFATGRRHKQAGYLLIIAGMPGRVTSGAYPLAYLSPSGRSPGQQAFAGCGGSCFMGGEYNAGLGRALLQLACYNLRSN